MLARRRRLYPRNWKQITTQRKEQAGWRCEWCHIRHGSRRRRSRRTGKPYTTWLHAAHVHPGDTLNPHPDLLILCPRCHGRYDYWYRMRAIILRLEILKHRRLIGQWQQRQQERRDSPYDDHVSNVA